jgi:O-antigen/teichoic acid export membrane protein
MVRGAVGSFLVKGLAAGLSVITAAVLGRLLGPAGYGAYAYAISWVTLLSVPAVMGLDVLAIREGSRYIAKKEWGVLRGLLSWSFRMVLALALALALMTAGVLWLAHGRLESQMESALWISVPILPLLALLRLKLGTIQGLGLVVWAQVPQMVLLPLMLLFVAGALGLLYGLTSQYAIGAHLLAAAFALVIAVFLLRKTIRARIPHATTVRDHRLWLSSAYPLLFVSVAVMVNDQIGVIILGSMAGPKEAGLFDVVRKASALVTFVLYAINMPMGPTVAELYAKGDSKQLQKLATKGARSALLGSLPIALVLIAFGPWLLRIVGKDFAGGATALSILCLGQIVNAGMGSVGLILNMTGYERDTAKGIAIAAVVNIILNLLFIPSWGIEGAAAASAVSVMVWNILLAIWVYQRIGIDPTSFGWIRFGGHRK